MEMIVIVNFRYKLRNKPNESLCLLFRLKRVANFNVTIF